MHAKYPLLWLFLLVFILSACQGIGLSQPLDAPYRRPLRLTVFTAALVE